MNFKPDCKTLFTVLSAASILSLNVSFCIAESLPEATAGQSVSRESPDEHPSPAARDNTAEKSVEPESPVYRDIIGDKFIYVVKKEESLRSIGARTGMNWRTIAKENRLNPAKHLEPGRKLVIDTRRIVPVSMQSGIVINIPEQALYLFRDNRPDKVFPVGLGRKQGKPPVMWRTPTGNFRIVGKQKNPAWHVPLSIRKEMRNKNQKVIVTFPPGNRNPLGKYALRTSLPGIMIHGTTTPESVFGFSSHGCIRMLAGNIRELFNDIDVKTKGEIIYRPVKMAVSEDGRVFLEVHRDIYNKYKNLESEVKRLVEINNAESMVDWQKIKDSLKLKSGVVEDITLESDRRYTAKASQ
jgi:L,D-transpeptidase ErfK/SrfK